MEYCAADEETTRAKVGESVPGSQQPEYAPGEAYPSNLISRAATVTVFHSKRWVDATRCEPGRTRLLSPGGTTMN